MDINEKLIGLFAELELTAEQDEYTGSEEMYVTFQYEDETGALYGDNEEEAVTYHLQVLLMTPQNFNYQPLKKQIKKALRREGFAVTGIRSFLGDMYSETEKVRTTAFTVNITVMEE